MKKRSVCISLFAVLALTILPITASAAPPSPFVGHWQATDVDGSDVRLTIAGPPGGPFQITWTENYISFCGGEAGIVRGTGWLNERDANLLEADLHVECFTTGASTDFHLTFRYHPATDTLSARYPSGMAVAWHRPGGPPPSPPALNLRVNYGHDWVEGFYEAGHFIYLTVTESDGLSVKATAELLTEPKDFWGGETGFQTVPEDWEPGQPDIQPYDWVYGWVDNGASAQVQIGDIGGAIDLAGDSIQGTISAPWFSDEMTLDVECFPWGAPEPQPEMKYDSILPNGEDTYSCSWAGEWEIQPWQDVGVGYLGPDGQWVANAFNVFLAPHFYVFPEWDYIIGWEWPAGTIVSAEVYHPGNEGDPDCEATAEMAHPEWSEEVYVAEFSLWESCDIQAGDRVLLTGDLVTREHTVLPLQVNLLDGEANTIGGVTEPGTEEVHAWVHGEDGTFQIVAPDADGNWTVDFSPFDLAPGMGGRAEQFDADGDATSVDWSIPNPRFTVFPEWEWFDGMEWPDGAMVTVSVEGKPECAVPVESWGGFFNGGFPEGCDVVVGDTVNMTDGGTLREHTVRNLAITTVDADGDIVAGTADAYAEVFVWPHATGGQILATADGGGDWLVDFAGVFDLVRGECGRAEIRDEVGNSTAVDWCVPNPVFTAFPEQEAVEGWEWPLGAVVHLTIDDPATPDLPDHEQDEMVVLTPWGSGQLWVWFDLAGSYDMKPGDFVTLTDGVTLREHTVRNLAITTVDADGDIVAGTADAYTEVFVWPYATGEQILATADGGGDWLVDFSGVFDLIPDECGRAEIRDTVGNGTAVDWCVPPPPRILVQISEDWFMGQNFAPSTEQSYEIYAAQGGALLLSGTMQADGQGTAGVWVGDQLDLLPGQYLVVSDGSTTKELVLEALAFDVFDPTQGLLLGSAPPPAERLVWVGIGWENDAWTMEVWCDQDGNWAADFDTAVPGDYLWVAAQVFDPDGDISEVRPSPRSLTAGRFHVVWSLVNPEEVVYLSWNGSDNLTNAWAHPACPDDLEFFGNAWVTENEGDPSFFFGSLVGWGTTGSWSDSGTQIDIGSISSGCPGSAELPIQTTYQFFDDELRADVIRLQRGIEFGTDPYEHDVRAFIPRLYPADGFTQVLYPDGGGQSLVTKTTDDCGLGCKVTDWNGSWFAIHNPVTGLGMIVWHEPSDYPVALWVDIDGGSFTNSSSVLLLQPSGGFVGSVTETEYLCFYDSSWSPSLVLPSGCQP